MPAAVLDATDRGQSLTVYGSEMGDDTYVPWELVLLLVLLVCLFI